MADSSSYSDDSDELAPPKIMKQYVAEQSIPDSFAKRPATKIKTRISSEASQ
jgi:hypothetical protein